MQTAMKQAEEQSLKDKGPGADWLFLGSSHTERFFKTSYQTCYTSISTRISPVTSVLNSNLCIVSTDVLQTVNSVAINAQTYPELWPKEIKYRKFPLSKIIIIGQLLACSSYSSTEMTVQTKRGNVPRRTNKNKFLPLPECILPFSHLLLLTHTSRNLDKTVIIWNMVQLLENVTSCCNYYIL